MVRIVVWVIVTFLSWWLSPLHRASAGWGPQGCAAVAVPVLEGVYQQSVPVASQPKSYWWKEVSTEPDQVHLYLGSRQQGTYNHETGKYQPLLDYERNVWGKPTASPFPPPASLSSMKGCKIEHVGQEEVLNFGLGRRDQVEADTYSTRHGKIEKHAAYAAVDKSIPDDAAKLRLVVIAKDEERKQILADYATVPLSEKVAKVWAVPPGHFSLKDTTTGKALYAYHEDKPTIYLVTSSGKVLHRGEGYKSGDFQAIRRAIDGYDPVKDPDLRRIPVPVPVPTPLPGPQKPFDIKDVPVAVWIGGGIVLILLVGRRKP